MALRIRESEFCFSKNWRDFKEEISLESKRRDWSRFCSESFGDMKALTDGRRFLGGKACGDIAITEIDCRRLEFEINAKELDKERYNKLEMKHRKIRGNSSLKNLFIF